MRIKIVQVTKENSDLLSNVDETVFAQEIDANRLAQFLDDRSYDRLVASMGNEVVGQISSVVHKQPDKPTELYVDDLAVAEHCLRQGIGTLLLKEVAAIGDERGCGEIWVATEPGNEPAKECLLFGDAL